MNMLSEIRFDGAANMNMVYLFLYMRQPQSHIRMWLLSINDK